MTRVAQLSHSITMMDRNRQAARIQRGSPERLQRDKERQMMTANTGLMRPFFWWFLNSYKKLMDWNQICKKTFNFVSFLLLFLNEFGSISVIKASLAEGNSTHLDMQPRKSCSVVVSSAC